MERKGMRTRNIDNLKSNILVALFSVIIAICSRIIIPAVVPFTLQSLGVFLALYILGGKSGLLSILIYIVLGLVVFLVVFLITRYVSLSSMAVITVLMIEFLFFTLMNYTYVDPEWMLDCQIIVILFAALCYFTHRKNICKNLYSILRGHNNDFFTIPISS